MPGGRVLFAESTGPLQCGPLDQANVVDIYMGLLLVGSMFILATLLVASRVRSTKKLWERAESDVEAGTVASFRDDWSSTRSVNTERGKTETDALLGDASHNVHAEAGYLGPLANPAEIPPGRGWRCAERLCGGTLANSVLVFPIYFHVLSVTCVVLTLRGLMLVFVDRTSLFYGVAYLGIFNGLNAAAREGLLLFLCTRSVGRDIVRRCVLIAAIWGVGQSVLGINFFFEPGRQHQYLNTNLWYFILHDGSIFLFDLCVFMVMSFRQNDRVGRFHMLYAGFFTLGFASYFVGDIGSLFESDWYGCSALTTQLFVFGLWAPITYLAVRADSKYWRQIGEDMEDLGANFSTGTRKWLGAADEGDTDDDLFHGRTLAGKAGKSLFSELRATVLPNYTALLDFTEIKLGKVIGAGGSASVFLGSWQGKPVAIKRFDSGSFTRNDVRAWIREVRINATLKHKNIIAVHGVCVALPDLLLVVELAERGSLFDVLSRAGDDLRKLPMRRRIRMARDCAAGLAHLHSQDPPIAHIDLKSLNYLVDRDMNVKLADFGESRMTQSGDDSHAHINTKSLVNSTVNWMAPESFENSTFSTKSDVYSLGCVFYEIISGRPPFDRDPQWRIGALVVDKAQRPEIPAVCPPRFRRLIEQCWSQKPIDRPSCIDVHSQLLSMVDEIDSIH